MEQLEKLLAILETRHKNQLKMKGSVIHADKCKLIINIVNELIKKLEEEKEKTL